MQTTNNDIYIDGVKLYPTTEPPKVSNADLQASAVRSYENGVLVINNLRNDMISVDLQWADIPLSEALKIYQCLKPKVDGGNLVKLFTPEVGALNERRMYRSDRTFTQTPYMLGMYASVSVTLVEM